MGIIIGLPTGILIGAFIVIILPGLCFHKWGQWKEVKGLHITVLGELGDRADKEYRRFERHCEKCGKVKLQKKRSG